MGAQRIQEVTMFALLFLLLGSSSFSQRPAASGSMRSPRFTSDRFSCSE